MQQLHVCLDRFEHSLGAVFNASIPITESEIVSDVQLQCTANPVWRSVTIELVNAIQSETTEKKAQIWTNKKFIDSTGGFNIRQIFMNEVLYYREQSNGEPCKLVVFNCICRNREGSRYNTRYNSRPMLLKFRKVEAATSNERFTEIEGSNAMMIDRTPGLCDLFPALFCLVRLEIAVGPQSNELWEGIGMELLDSSPRVQQQQDETFYRKCFEELCKLHAFGYIHGDAHIGNFVRNPETGAARLIDQDDIIKLQSKEDTMSKYKQILDFIELLYWANPYITAPDVNRFDLDMHQVFGAHPDLSVLFPPFGFIGHRMGMDDIMERDLTSAAASKIVMVGSHRRRGRQTKKTQNYWRFVSSLTVQDIEEEFARVFQSPEQMLDLNRKIESYLRPGRYKKPRVR